MNIRDPNCRIYSLALWLGLLTLGIASVFAALYGLFLNAASSAGFVVAFIAWSWWSEAPPRAVMAVAVWAAAFNALGWIWNLFKPIYLYDEFAHTVGALAATAYFTSYVYRPLLPRWSQNRAAVSLAVFNLGISLGVGWEVAEWAGFYVSARMARQVYDDILSDLLFDALGALAAIPLAYWAHTTAES